MDVADGMKSVFTRDSSASRLSHGLGVCPSVCHNLEPYQNSAS